jgi:hypothetical protein
MSSVAEIKQAIVGLSPKEMGELELWLDERNRNWDEEIERDAVSGKLQRAYERLKASDHKLPEVPLNDFLDDEKLP